MLVNGSFEVAGARSYLASGWTSHVSVTTGGGAYSFAEYAVLDAAQQTDTKDTFDWAVLKADFVGFYDDLSYAFYDTTTDVEDFEDLWGAGPATVDSVDGPYALVNGQVLTIKVDGGAEQSIGFLSGSFTNITDARPEEVAIAINTQLVGAVATLVGGHVRITSASTGPAASLQVTGGTANTALQFLTSVALGTSDGNPWIDSMEFSFAVFAGTQPEAETFRGDGWSGDFIGIPIDLTTDVNDRSDRLDILSPDTFATGWGTNDLTADANDTSGRLQFVSFEGLNAETFPNSLWDLMTTIR